MKQNRLFIIDDNPDIGESIALALQPRFSVDIFTSAEDGLKALKKMTPDVILLDIELPGMSGIDALKKIKETDPEIPVVMISGCDEIDTVVTAIKLGAYDYVVKPLETAALKVTLKNVRENLKLKKKVIELQEKSIQEQTPLFIGESSIIQEAMEFIGKIAKSPDTPVLILGETGTGKEIIAQTIHLRSPVADGPFIPVNCAAIPRELIESELFGYEKGAFTGAKTSGKSGLIEEASGGTLFLDEVGDLSLEAQAKLLRFLESGEFYRVGGTKTVKVQTRVVSATNRDILAMIEKERFRKDLYFRLGVLKVEMPSLNDRPDCIMPLVTHFINEFNQKFQKDFKGVSPEAEKLLTGHSWMGNVRELKNLIERAVLIGDGPDITPADLGLKESSGSGMPESDQPFFPPLTENGIQFKDVMHAAQEFYVREAMKLAGGVERKAAKYLNLNHQTFRYHRQNLDKEKP